MLDEYKDEDALEQESLTKAQTRERTVRNIAELKRRRNVTVTLRNKVENIYRYAQAHPKVLTPEIQSFIELYFSGEAHALTDEVKMLHKSIQKLVGQVKNMK